MTFKLCSELALPANAATDTYAFLGTRGSGKTYAAGKMVETFLDGGVQVAVIDLVGVWWGLRLAADGKRPGIDIPVFGGWHGDIPLEPTAGELVAKLVAEQGLSVVLDISEFTGGQQHRFVRDFSRAVFHMKKTNRSPLHVLLEEAHELLPQQVGPGEAEMVGNVKRLWKIGRNFGIGGSLVSQRAAEVNKGALNLTEVMFCGKLKGPQDRKAIAGWAKDQDVDEGHLTELPTLPKGTLFCWRDSGCVKVRVDPKRTYDASKTPEEGDARPAQALPRIDLDQVRVAMAATIEESKASDPKALRVTIEELRRQLARAIARPATVTVAPSAPQRVQVPVFPAPMLEAVIAAEALARDVQRVAMQTHGKLEGLLADARAIAARPAAPPVATPAISALVVSAGAVNSPLPNARRFRLTDTPAATMPEGCRKALTVMAQFPDGVTRKKLGILSGYAPAGSSMRGILAKLRAEQWVEDLPGDVIRWTVAGETALGIYRPLPSGSALRAHWLGELPECPRRILEALVAAHPVPLTKAAIEAATGSTGTAYTAGGSSMRGGLARLRALDLVVDVGEAIRASDELFDASEAAA